MSYFNLGDGATNFDPELQFDNDIDKQMTNKELADEAARLVTNYETFLCEHIDAWREFCGKNREKIVDALSASAVAEPVAQLHHTIRYVLDKDEDLSQFAIDELTLALDLTGYDSDAHPAPAAPVLASVREALEKIAKMCRPHASNEQFDGAILTIVEQALASLPAPEAAPTREEIVSVLINEASDTLSEYEIGEQAERQADAILALKEAPATINRIK